MTHTLPPPGERSCCQFPKDLFEHVCTLRAWTQTGVPVAGVGRGCPLNSDKLQFPQLC